MLAASISAQTRAVQNPILCLFKQTLGHTYGIINFVHKLMILSAKSFKNPLISSRF